MFGILTPCEAISRVITFAIDPGDWTALERDRATARHLPACRLVSGCRGGAVPEQAERTRRKGALELVRKARSDAASA